MPRRKPRRRAEDLFEEPPKSHRTGRANQSKRKKSRRWPFVLLILLIGLALLPNIICWTGLHQRAIRFALRDFNGEVQIEQASLGWLQPVSILNFSASDPAGEELLRVQRLTTSKTLVELISGFFRGGDYGTIEIQRPIVRLEIRPDGSNFEDAIARYLNSSQTPPLDSGNELSVLPKLKLKINDGQALIIDSQDSLFWQVEDWQSSVDTVAGNSPLELETRAKVTPVGVDPNGQRMAQPSGQIFLQSHIDSGKSQLELASAEVVIAADNLPLSMIAPLAQRLVGPLRSDGRLTAQLRSQVDLNELDVLLDVQGLQVTDLVMQAPQWIGDDRLNLQQMFAEGKLRLSSQMISSSGFRMQSDFGKLRSNGSFNLRQIDQLSQNLTLLDEPLELSGEIDLARLMRMLPTTLRLHPDLSIESGLVQFQANTRAEGDSRRLIFLVDTANLRAFRGDQPIVWQKPLHLSGAIVQANDRIAINNFQCETDFLQIAGNANAESASFAMRGDLQQLVDQVGNFVDLAGMQANGKLVGDFGWSTADPIQDSGALPIQIGGRFSIADPVLLLPGSEPWEPTSVVVSISGSGSTRSDAVTSNTILKLAQAGCQIDIGDEQLVATLAQPLQNAFIDSPLLNLKMEGDLNRWLAHLRNFVDPGSFQAAGKMLLTGQARYADSIIRLREVVLKVEQLDFEGYGLQIQDPQANAQFDLTYDGNQQLVTFDEATFISSAVAAGSPQIRMQMGDQYHLDGEIGFRGDINRLADWMQLSPDPESIYWYGGIEGKLNLSSNREGTAGEISSKIIDLVAVQQQTSVDPQTGQLSQPRWVELFRDQQTRMDSQFVLADDFDSILFHSLKLQSAAGLLEAQGSLADLTGRLIANLQGSWSPDWNQLQQLVAVYSGDTLFLTGSGQKPFAIRGPLFSADSQTTTAWLPAELQANTAFRWDEGRFLEVPIGASEISVQLKDGIAAVGTKGIPFSGGMIQANPFIDFRGNQPMLTMSPTRVIDQVALTEVTARQWLKFVAPLVADSTSAQGVVTLDMENLQMPLLDPMNLQAQGNVQLDNVVLGAGPLTEQLITTVEQLRAIIKPDSSNRDYRTWLRLNRQQIPFLVKDQQVYHENVTIAINDITVITQGAVGFDQSLNMLAEIPIEDDWIEGRPLLAGLKGQRLRIPIGGTVSQPQLDRRVLQGLSAELARSAAGGAINQLLGDRLRPQADQLQGQVNDRVTGELNRLQNRLGDKLEGADPNLGGLIPNLEGWGLLPGGNQQAPITPRINPPDGSNQGDGQSQTSDQKDRPLENLGRQLEDELRGGIRDLFRRRNRD